MGLEPMHITHTHTQTLPPHAILEFRHATAGNSHE